MVDFETVRTLAPHYVVMLLLAILTVGVVRSAAGERTLIVEFPAVLAVLFLYPFALRRLGYAPEPWE